MIRRGEDLRFIWKDYDPLSMPFIFTGRADAGSNGGKPRKIPGKAYGTVNRRREWRKAAISDIFKRCFYIDKWFDL